MEKSVNGNISQIRSESIGSSIPSHIGITAKGSAITIKAGSSAASLEAGGTKTETFNQTATKHGISYGYTETGAPTGITAFTLVDAL